MEQSSSVRVDDGVAWRRAANGMNRDGRLSGIQVLVRGSGRRGLEVWRLRALDARRKELCSRGCTCVAYFVGFSGSSVKTVL